MFLSRFPGMSPCVLLLALAADALPARAQEVAENELRAAFDKAKELQKPVP